jgi:hypothetical protein
MEDMEGILKYLTLGLLGFAAFIGCLLLGFKIFGPEYEEPTREPNSVARMIDVGNASFNLHVVTVDGVDYVVSTTYRGVGICPKVVKEVTND